MKQVKSKFKQDLKFALNKQLSETMTKFKTYEKEVALTQSALKEQIDVLQDVSAFFPENHTKQLT